MTFSLSRRPTQPATFGQPHTTPPILPTQLRQAIGSSTFSATPLAGSILFCLGTQNADVTSPRSISGGGVTTWNLIAHTAVGGANNTSVASWWGVVSATPSAVVSLSVAGGVSQGTVMAEFTNLRGELRTSDGSASGVITMRTTYSGGVLVVLSAGQSTLTLPGGLVTATSVVSARTAALQYGAAAFPANTNATLTLADAGAKQNIHAVVIS